MTQVAQVTKVTQENDMASSKSDGDVQPQSRVKTQRLANYEARRGELSDAFRLPPDHRTWVTVRLDRDPGMDDTVSLGIAAGRTSTVMPFPIPAALKRALQEVLRDHKDDLEAQLKLDMATNMIALMNLPPAEGDSE
jgi:hypothetical protein